MIDNPQPPWHEQRAAARAWGRLQTWWTRSVRGSAFGRLPANATDEQIELMRVYGQALRGQYGQAVSVLNGLIYAAVFQTFFWGWRDRDAPLPWGAIAVIGVALAVGFGAISMIRLRKQGLVLETEAKRLQAQGGGRTSE